MAFSKVVNVNAYLSYASDVKRYWWPSVHEQFSNWNAQQTLEMMDRHNIAFNIFSQSDTKPFNDAALSREINEQYAQLISEYPKRFGGFAALPLKSIDLTLHEIEYALDTLRLSGICLPSNFSGIYMGDPRYAEIWQEIDRRNATVFIRPSYPAVGSIGEVNLEHEIIESMFEITRVVTSLVYSGTKRRHPAANVIVANGGGAIPFLAWRLGYFATIFGVGEGELEDYDAILKDIKSFYIELTAAATQHSLPTILKLIEPSHLMMGFDFPVNDGCAVDEAQTFISKYSELSEIEKNMIFSGTASKIIPGLNQISKI